MFLFLMHICVREREHKSAFTLCPFSDEALFMRMGTGNPTNNFIFNVSPPFVSVASKWMYTHGLG